MKKYFVLLLVGFVSFSGYSQKLEKIKGNKEVVDVYETLEDFNSIQISNQLEVTLKQSDVNDYHLETDSNLLDVIVFEIIDGALHIFTNKEIQSSKELTLDINFIDIDKITLYDNSEVKGLNRFEMDSLSVMVLDDSEFKLDVLTDELIVTMSNDTKGDLAVKGANLNVILNDGASLKGDLTVNDCVFAFNDSSDFEMDGDAANINVTTTGDTQTDMSELRGENVSVNTSDDSEIVLNATKSLIVYAQDDSVISIYGNPDIIMEGFKDSSMLIKK
ncbi:hypothetical protein SCB49_13990 [unidentified eubacterium SCB49]|nr:hypothetical protein SCB49_13990 [unidentified eubacterium SCB49]